MNTNRVYECSIHLNTSTIIREGKLMVLSRFVKKTLVYHTYSNKWVDLYTNECYTLGPEYGVDLFITRMQPIIPVSTIIDTKYGSEPKRKILKKYKEKNGGKNEKSI